MGPETHGGKSRPQLSPAVPGRVPEAKSLLFHSSVPNVVTMVTMVTWTMRGASARLPAEISAFPRPPPWGFPSLYLHPNPFPHCQPPWLSLPRLPLP